MDSVRRKVSNRVYSGETSDLKFNQASGADKVISAGHHLKPIFTGSGYTTNATTKINVGKGVTLAIYNNAVGIASATIGDSTVVSQVPGAVQAGTAFVGVALASQSFTYLNTYDKDYIVTSAATVLVYIVEDDTNIIQA